MNTLFHQLSAVPTRASTSARKRRWNTCAATLQSRRSTHTVHTRRELRYPIENGLGEFLPPNALKTVVEWQDGLLERLNEQVRGTPLAKPNVLQIIIDSAGDQKNVRAFNYACLAANNSFFLDCLKPPSEESSEDEPPPELMAAITPEFKDLNMLKERFVASASGMISSGWLWLVTDGQGHLAVVPTFASGTLLVRSSNYFAEVQQNILARQPLDSFVEPEDQPKDQPPSQPGVFPPLQDGLSPSSPVSGVKAPLSQLNPNTPARSFYSSAVTFSNPSVREEDTAYTTNIPVKRKQMHTRGSKLYPLLCLSLFEHTWISAGLGVWGKEEYVRRFFTVVDWKKVSDTYGKFTSMPKYRGAQRFK